MAAESKHFKTYFYYLRKFREGSHYKFSVGFVVSPQDLHGGIFEKNPE